jgi:hypothetical protein
MALKAVAFNVTLKSNGGDPSSTNRLIELIADSMRLHGVATIRLAEHNIKPGGRHAGPEHCLFGQTAEGQPVSRQEVGSVR